MFGLAPLPRTLEAAVRDAGSERREVRRSAVRDLARHARDSVEAEKTLRRALLEDADAEVRADAALALADAGARLAAPDLCRVAVEDLSTRVRQLALLALGEIGEAGPPVLAVLEKAGRSELPEERFQALLALHQLGANSAKTALIEGMADADAEVRRLAFRVSRAEWSEAVELPPEVREKARAALTDEDPGVRVAAALALADFGDASGKSLLLEIVQRRSRAAS
ncbi:MAG TPA: HEAT repeat domain-containing protein, partial [Polyangiaceae bacterium]